MGQPPQELTPLQSNTLDAVMLHCSRYVVGIVATEPPGIGSGTAIRWRERVFILSARHIFEQPVEVDPSRAGYLFRPREVRLDAMEALAGRQAGLAVPMYTMPIVAVFPFAHEDLIAIELEKGAEARFGFDLFEVNGRLKTPDEKGLVNYTGYPFDLTQSLGSPGGRVVMNAEWGNLELDVAPDRPVQNFNKDLHFIIPYLAALEGREPHGFSGSAVWWHEKPSSVWYPNLYMAGVVVEYYRNPGRLKCIRSSVIQQFLDEVVGISFR